jgi:hypothetical protein
MTPERSVGGRNEGAVGAAVVTVRDGRAASASAIT